MATVSEVRSLLDTLERVRLRADEVRDQIATAEETVSRLQADLAQLTPTVESAEAEFKSAVSRLTFDGASK